MINQVPDELKEIIEKTFKNGSRWRNGLLNCDPNAIRSLGTIVQKGMDPIDVLDYLDKGKTNLLRKKATRLLELQCLYIGLTDIYYKNVGKRSKGDFTIIE